MEQIFSSNMHCAACKGNIETRLKKINGIMDVNANLVTNVIKVRYNEKLVNDQMIIEACKEVGYRLEVIQDEIIEVNSSKKEKYDVVKLLIGSVLLALLMFLSMSHMYPDLIIPTFKEPNYILPLIELGLTLIIIGIFSSYYINGFKSLVKLSPNMDNLIFLGSFFSLVYSIYLIVKLIISPDSYFVFEHEEGKIMFHNYLDSAAMILVIVSIGKFIENLSKRKAKSTINELLKLRPQYANVLVDDKVKKIETKNLKSGDKVIIKEGETIPLDGIIISGTTSVDESLLTGESLPVFKDEGDEVIGGSINKDGSITVLIDKTKKENVLNRIISLVMEASNMDTNLTRKVDKVAKVFVPIVIAIALLTFLIWLIVDLSLGAMVFPNHFTSIFDEAFTFGVSVLVVSCPCALGLATPISLLVGSSVFAKRGILVNKSEAIESIKKVDTVVLDKTNTITNGKLTVVNKEIFTSDLQTLTRIKTIEQFSTHPLSEGIVVSLNEVISLDKTFSMIKNIPGKGVKGIYKDQTIFIGNASLLEEYCEDNKKEKILNSIDSSDGLLKIFAFTKEEILALFYLKDELKTNAKEFIKEIKKTFNRIILLTGDNEIIANNIAKEVGIEEVISEVKPLDKGNIIKKLKSEGHTVMMVGDGVNDSLALTESDVGIGLAKGSDVALASSDFILMNSNLDDILDIVSVSKRIRTNISFNLLWAFIYNVIFIPLAAGSLSMFGVMLSPMYASLLMALSSITVCLNSLTLFLASKHDNKNDVVK